MNSRNTTNTATAQSKSRRLEKDVNLKKTTVALRLAEDMGLLTGPKTKHFNAKVSPKLFQAAAKRVGTTSPAVVINAALASLATEDQLGPWLASRWGILSTVDFELLSQIDL
jgi:hypothetical protein